MATIYVAATNATSSEKSQAQYLCDGTQDQTQINQALDAAGTNGVVQLSSGDFYCTPVITSPFQSRANNIDIPAYRTLRGKGKDVTILHLNMQTQQTPHPYRCGIRHLWNNSACEDFSFTGSGAHVVQCSNVTVNRVEAFNLNNWEMAAFLMWAHYRFSTDSYYAPNQNRKDLTNVQYTDCDAIDVNRWGFLPNGYHDWKDITGTYWSGIKNVTYTRCNAINCGRYGQYQGGTGYYDVGIDLCEGAGWYENMTAIDCYASGTYESGFHADSGGNGKICKNVKFVNCISENNGTNPTPQYGSGFCTNQRGIIMQNCISRNNARAGYKIYYGAIMDNCSDEGSKQYGVMANQLYELGGLTMTNCSFDNNPVGFWLYSDAVSSIVMDGCTFTRSSQTTNPGILFGSLVSQTQNITIKNSLIQGFGTGVDNDGSGTAGVQIYNVCVIGALTPFSRCQIITSASGLFVSDTEQVTEDPKPNSPITVRAYVTACGTTPQSGTLYLKIGNQIIDQKPVTAYPGQTTTVDFAFVVYEEGIYIVCVV